MNGTYTGGSMGEPVRESRSTSPWVYIGIGCTVLLVVCLLAIGAVTFLGYRAIQSQVAENKDPAARTEVAKKILGCKGDLPDGYHAFMKLSIPWIMDMVILSDQENDFGDKRQPFKERGFLYIKALRGRHDKKMRDYIEGDADAGEFLKRGNIDMTSTEEIARGAVQMDDYTTYYISQRGTIRHKGSRLEGITTLFFFDCPGDQKFRLGVWFGPDPLAHGTASDRPAREDEPSDLERKVHGAVLTRELPGGVRIEVTAGSRHRATAVEVENDPAGKEQDGGGDWDSAPGEKRRAGPEFAGTPADETAMREFLSHFSPCGS